MLDAYKSAFSSAPIGMALVDKHGHFLDTNDAFCRITGYTHDQLRSRSLPTLSHPDDVDTDAAQREALVHGQLQSYQIEKRYVHASGHVFWILLTVSLVGETRDQPEYLISQIQDISDRKELEGRLAHLVDHDFITGLFNRRYFEQALRAAMTSAVRYGREGAVLLLDLDNFKEINDRFGHTAGDDLLRTVGTALKAQLRQTDVVARLGGDEFGVILSDADANQAQAVAGELLKLVRRQAAMLGEDVIRVTASVGGTTYGDLNDVEVLAGADMAMYEAKAAGRDGFSMYRALDRHDRPLTAARLVDAEGIRRAMVDRRLVLYCQPILDLRTNQVAWYELLVRLRNEQGELLLPTAFMYIAERLGTIVAIDSWVVEAAVALIADQGRAGGATTFSVNVSGKSVSRKEFVALIDRLLNEDGVDPTRLVFELSETAAISNLENAKAFINSVRGRGCKVALDDFGVGFGSFFYLKEIPFDYLKIDGDFIRGVSVNNADRLVVEAIVGIAQGMGRQTVAEFVTDADMTDRLRVSGVDYAQGYHIGAPRPVTDLFP